jgi:hypothetical protein
LFVLKSGNRLGSVALSASALAIVFASSSALGSDPTLKTSKFQQSQVRVKKSWFEKNVLDRLELSGTRTLGYQKFSFEGDPDAFASLTNFGTGNQTFTDIGNLSLQGNSVLGFLNFRANFTDNRFSDPEQQQYLLSYQKGPWDLNYGTVQASLQSNNQFLNFSRSLEGIVAGYKLGRFETRFLRSEARGAARTATIEGNNTSGPYFINSGRIIGGSVNVLLDGVQLRPGADFVLNTDEGSITFIGRTIPPSSAIVVSFESFDLSSQRGTIEGQKFAYDFGGFGSVSFSRMSQAAGSGTTNNTRIELFQGFGRPGDQYFLQFEPITTTIVVTVNGVIRSFAPFDDGVSEFYSDPALPIRIISRVAVPTTQELQIRYTPSRLQTSSTDRSVTGFDWTIPLDKKSGSNISYSTSMGGPTGGASGKAESLRWNFNEGKGRFQAGYRKIDPNYQGIEQTAFNRNEQASDLNYEYFTKGFTTKFKNLNSVISTSDNNILSSTRLMTNNLEVGYSFKKKKEDSPNRGQSVFYRTTQTTQQNENFLAEYGLREVFSHKKLNYTIESSQQVGRVQQNSTLSDYRVTGYKATVGYNAGKNIFVSATGGRNHVNLGQQNSEGFDYSLRASLSQTGPWTGGIDYTATDSGAISSLGFVNGNSIGFGGNGFSGNNGVGTITNGTFASRRTGFTVGYQASGFYTGGLSLARTVGTGAATNNADIETLTLTNQFQINKNNTLNLDWTRVNSVFQNSTIGNATSYLWNMQFSGNQGKLWSYSLNANTLTSSGGGFAQDSLGFQGDLTYLINGRQRLIGSASVSRMTGFAPQEDRQISAAYAYQLIPGIDLRARYLFRDLQNLDPTAIGGAFRSNGFSIELTFSLLPRR